MTPLERDRLHHALAGVWFGVVLGAMLAWAVYPEAVPTLLLMVVLALFVVLVKLTEPRRD